MIRRTPSQGEASETLRPRESAAAWSELSDFDWRGTVSLGVFELGMDKQFDDFVGFPTVLHVFNLVIHVFICFYRIYVGFIWMVNGCIRFKLIQNTLYLDMDQNSDPENGWFWTKNDQSIETKICTHQSWILDIYVQNYKHKQTCCLHSKLGYPLMVLWINLVLLKKTCFFGFDLLLIAIELSHHSPGCNSYNWG